MASTKFQYIARCAQATDTVYGVASEAILLLKRRGDSLGVAESLTGGGLMAAITSIAGASAVFRGGVVSYDTRLKEELLKVESDLIAQHGVIHAEVSKQMAEGARTITTFNGLPTTWGIGTTGVAGPTSQDDKPVGMVFIGLASPQRSKGFGPFLFPGNREQIREATVIEALALLCNELRKEPGKELEEDEVTVTS